MTRLSIAQVKELLKNEVTAEILTTLVQDERKGIQKALASYRKRQEKVAQAKLAFAERLRLEQDLWAQGIEYVAGIDEVGRGPLAGPVVTAAVILPHDFDLYEVNDSKQLSVAKREELYGKILEQALAVNIGVASNRVIDQVNIYEATKIAMKEAVLGLRITPQHLLVDAMPIELALPQTKLIKGDAKSASISAASIVAKVTRDHLMTFYDRIYPGYGFSQNDGYGTKQHLAGLIEHGTTPIHRMTFEPIKSKYAK